MMLLLALLLAMPQQFTKPGVVPPQVQTIQGCHGVASCTAVDISGTISASSSVHSTASAPTYVEGTDNPFSSDLTGSLRVICMSGTCGGASPFADGAAFTAGTTSVSVIAGVFNDSLGALASGKAAAPRQTSFRAMHFNLRDNSGNEIPFPAALAASGGMKVDVQNASLAVTGTFWQATQPVSGTFWQATQPVSGTVAVSNSFALDATLTGGTQKAIVRGGAKGATAAADVTSTANGADHQGLDVAVQGTVTVSGTVTTTPPANASTNVAQLAGTTTDTNSGVKSAGTLRVVLATDQPALTNKLLVTPDSVALPANQSVNVNQFGASNVVTGTGAGGAGIPRVTISNDSTVGQAGAPWTFTEQPATTGGLSIKRTLSAATTNSTNAKASVGQVYGWYITNISITAKFVKLYDAAAAPTCGSGTPVITLLIPAQGTASLGAGATSSFGPGLAFANGIGYCITGAAADADTTAVAANDVIVNLFYK